MMAVLDQTGTAQMIRSTGLLVIAVAISACATSPPHGTEKVQEGVVFQLTIPDVKAENISVTAELGPSDPEKFKCGPGKEIKYSDFTPTPALFLKHALALEIMNEASKLPGTSIATEPIVFKVSEFRVWISNSCGSTFSPQNNSHLAAIHPVGPLFGMGVERLVHELGNDKGEFVHVRITTRFDGAVVSEDYRIYPRLRRREDAIEEALGYHAKAVAGRLLDLSSSKVEFRN